MGKQSILRLNSVLGLSLEKACFLIACCHMIALVLLAFFVPIHIFLAWGKNAYFYGFIILITFYFLEFVWAFITFQFVQGIKTRTCRQLDNFKNCVMIAVFLHFVAAVVYVIRLFLFYSQNDYVRDFKLEAAVLFMTLLLHAGTSIVVNSLYMKISEERLPVITPLKKQHGPSIIGSPNKA